MDECEKRVYGTDVWRTNGATAKMVIEYARITNRVACCLHGDKAIETWPGTNALVFAIDGNHACFYVDKRVRKQLMNRKPHGYQRIKKESRKSERFSPQLYGGCV